MSQRQNIFEVIQELGTSGLCTRVTHVDIEVQSSDFILLGFYQQKTMPGSATLCCKVNDSRLTDMFMTKQH